MIGSAAVAAFIAHVVFWSLLVGGIAFQAIGIRGAAVFAALWLLGRFGLPALFPSVDVFASYIAALDIALVLMIFKGDVRLT